MLAKRSLAVPARAVSDLLNEVYRIDASTDLFKSAPAIDLSKWCRRRPERTASLRLTPIWAGPLLSRGRRHGQQNGQTAQSAARLRRALKQGSEKRSRPRQSHQRFGRGDFPFFPDKLFPSPPQFRLVLRQPEWKLGCNAGGWSSRPASFPTL